MQERRKQAGPFRHCGGPLEKGQFGGGFVLVVTIGTGDMRVQPLYPKPADPRQVAKKIDDRGRRHAKPGKVGINPTWAGR